MRAETDGEKAVAGADIIVTTTPSETPIVKAGWLQPASTSPPWDPTRSTRTNSTRRRSRKAGLYVADSLKQTRRLGELHHAITAGLVAADAEFAELGQVIAGLKPGRTSADQITIADLTGTGVQDTAIATLARDRARAANAGTTFES